MSARDLGVRLRCIRLELERLARDCFAFIQLVDGSMFQRYPNWCYVEFEAAAEDPSRVLIFVMGEPFASFISRDRVREKLLEWHARVVAEEAVVLAPATTEAEARSAVKLINDKIAARVEAARAQLYGKVPV